VVVDVIPQVEGDRYLVRYGRQVVAVDVYPDGTVEATVPLGHNASRRAIRAAIGEVRRLLEEEEEERWWSLSQEQRTWLLKEKPPRG